MVVRTHEESVFNLFRKRPFNLISHKKIGLDIASMVLKNEKEEFKAEVHKEIDYIRKYPKH